MNKLKVVALRIVALKVANAGERAKINGLSHC